MAIGQGRKKCVKCHTPFDASDTRFSGSRRRYGSSPFCHACVDRCGDSEIADHWCEVDRWRYSPGSATPDDDLCSSTYPGHGPDFGMLCNRLKEHGGTDHRALAEVAPTFRRYVVWSADGRVLPDVEERR
ncbi:hypothetical protein [Streptomyces sp. 5-10]|uniref:hypothetical protein n=1 Tax=Streptomyces sp. 5-10 TaxID=878925 RepID=UPI00168BC3ED|nr:hypothetical protein [Streptomyces sp. 5-10]MBD3004688.1 hypothetical protein [Streptomyces sp. 5-10]